MSFLHGQLLFGGYIMSEFKCPICSSFLQHPLDIHSDSVRLGAAKLLGAQMTEKKKKSNRLNAQKPRPNRKKKQGEPNE